MSGTIKIGSYLGIDVRIHFSWVFIFLLVAWSVANLYLTEFYNFSATTRWIIGVICSLLLFASVLVHEFSHSLVALSRKHRVRSITLFFLGGVSEIEDEAHSAGEEFWIAFAGPLTSFVLGVLFLVLFALTPDAVPTFKAVFQYLFTVNFLLAVFNMIPAYPLDGGRVLKSIVWRSTNNESRSINVASLAGSIVGFTFIAIGILSLFGSFGGSFGGNNAIFSLWLVFIGWFIQSSASSARRERVTEMALSGKTVRDAMRPHIPTVAPGMTVQALLDQYMNKDFERAYIVTLGGDSYQGLVTVTNVKTLPPEQRSEKYITEIMIRASEVKTVEIGDPLEAALDALVSTGYHQLVVVDDDKAVGLITRGDVLRVLEIAQLLPSNGGNRSKFSSAGR